MEGIHQSTIVLCTLALLLSSASGCIFKYGTSPDSLAAHGAGTAWDFGFNGDDWEGVDGTGKPWACMTGKQQSPINIPATSTIGERIPRNHQTQWYYPPLVSNGSNIEIINNGHAIQIEWLSSYAADVKIVVPAKPTNATRITDVVHMPSNTAFKTVKAVPTNFHFHSVSDHAVGGAYFPLELHIVHKVTDLPACANGCYTVTGFLFELTDGPDNEVLESIWKHLPMREGEIVYLPAGEQIPLGKLLPKPNQRDYVTYEGGLTVPPCTEGLLWHVMARHQHISHKQWREYRTAVGMKECTLKNGTAPADHSTAPPPPHHHHHHRRMLATATATESHADDYTCKVVAYGSNSRSAQPLNGRHVKIARAA